MIDFPLTKDEWYKLRDDRTRRLEEVTGFEDKSVGVIVNPEVSSSYPIQAMTLITLNMLARWCRKIAIQIPSDTISCLPNYHKKDFCEILKNNLSEADPYGQFAFKDVEKEAYNQTLFIGKAEENRYDDKAVWIDGCGWIAGVAYNAPQDILNECKQSNPIGPAFASCLGVAELFRRAIGLLPSSTEPSWYSLYDLKKADSPLSIQNPPFISNFNFGRIHQVGCGAVASCLDFLLPLTNWTSEIFLIDDDRVEVSNCNRSLSFSAWDAVSKRAKVDVCADALQSTTTMKAISFNGTYGNFIGQGKFLDFPPDLILCLANDHNVWGDIQNNYPPLVFHATTTKSWGINFGRHIPKKEWCVICRFRDEMNLSLTPICGESEVSIKKTEGESTIEGVLPFLSPAAAILTMAEMAKIPLAGYPMNDDFIEFSLRNIDGNFVQSQRKHLEECLCKDQPISLYPKEITSGKFWHLTEN